MDMDFEPIDPRNERDKGSVAKKKTPLRFTGRTKKPVILVFLILDGSISFVEFRRPVQNAINELIMALQKDYRSSGKDIYLTVMQFNGTGAQTYLLDGEFVDPEKKISIELPEFDGTTDIGDALNNALMKVSAQLSFLKDNNAKVIYSPMFFLFSDLVPSCGSKEEIAANAALQKKFEQTADYLRRLEEHRRVVVVTCGCTDKTWPEDVKNQIKENLKRISPVNCLSVYMKENEPTEISLKNLKRFFVDMVQLSTSSVDPRATIHGVFNPPYSN